MKKQIKLAKVGVPLTLALMMAFTACTNSTQGGNENGNGNGYDNGNGDTPGNGNENGNGGNGNGGAPGNGNDNGNGDKPGNGNGENGNGGEPSGPTLYYWAPIEHQKTIYIAPRGVPNEDIVPEEREPFTLTILDKTRLGMRVDADGKNADGVVVEGLVTEAILQKFYDALRLQEDRLDRSAPGRQDWRNVLSRVDAEGNGFRIILNTDGPTNAVIRTWNTVSYHIDNVSTRDAASLRNNLDGQITQHMIYIPEPQAASVKHDGIDPRALAIMPSVGKNAQATAGMLAEDHPKRPPGRSVRA